MTCKFINYVGNNMFETCKTRATYGLMWQKPTHCAKHKEIDEIDVKNKKCIFLDCQKQPTYALFDQKPIHCSEHKEHNEIDVISKRCIFPDCNIRPSYALPNSRTTIHCVEHKEQDEIDITHKRCSFPNCQKQPSYALLGQKPVHCSEHKEIDEIDVKNKRCSFPNCQKIPSYALSGQTPVHCLEHKEIDEIDVKHKRCIFPDCNIRPSYALPNSRTTIHCSEHKEIDEIDIISKRCKTNLCDVQATKKYDGYCARCYFYMNPDQKQTNYKTKENLVAMYLQNTFKDYTWTFDKTISDGCSRRRPDAAVDFGSHVVIVETDENQHLNPSKGYYAEVCEEARINEIFLDYSEGDKNIVPKKIIFIRFNPDNYKTKAKSVPSPFEYSVTGILQLKRKKDWNDRLEALRKKITECIAEPEELITHHHLFYTSLN